MKDRISRKLFVLGFSIMALIPVTGIFRPDPPEPVLRCLEAAIAFAEHCRPLIY
ncbi:MAG: hypothetical protein R3335_07585 [Anaerolineales bacterium]|nr:hypothetical protein [Anaerolineales bacterium]